MLNDFFLLMRSELIITAILFILLALKLTGKSGGGKMLSLIQFLLLLNFISGFLIREQGVLFDGMFRTSHLIALQKNILNGGVYMISLLFGSWFSRQEHLIEFFILLLSSLLGMFLMISSGNLLMFYLSLELATIPVAALANFDLDKQRSSEAAMKMILSSAFSSGIMLFGISLIYGITGTLRFEELSAYMPMTTLSITAFVFFLSAFAFKLSVVPFHFWTADVYEGAPLPVAAFLSVISKGAVAFVFITVLFKVFPLLYPVWYYFIVFLAMATMLVGNLFALRQQNLKRFLAFSSIAQVGFILAAISSNSVDGVVSVNFFILIYLFSNLAAFAVLDAVATQTGKERIDDLKGFYKTNPFLSWVLAIAMFSLAGIPPTAGFFGKLFLLSSGAGTGNYWFLTFAALNMVISLFYYLKVVRAIFMEKNETPLEKIRLNAGVRTGLIICATVALAAGLMGWLLDYITDMSV